MIRRAYLERLRRLLLHWCTPPRNCKRPGYRRATEVASALRQFGILAGGALRAAGPVLFAFTEHHDR